MSPVAPHPSYSSRRQGLFAALLRTVGSTAAAAVLLLTGSCADGSVTDPRPNTPVAPPVAIAPGNTAPSTLFAIAPRWPRPGDTVTVDGSYSHDADGQVVSYHWSFGNGVTETTSAIARTVFRTAGTYTLSLTTVDDGGDSTTVSMSLVVNSAGAPSSAVDSTQSTLTISSASTTAGTPVTATVTARTASGTAITGAPVAVSALGRNIAITPSLGTTGAGGVATATVASSIAQATTVRAVADYTALSTTRALTIASSVISASRSAVRLTQSTFTATGDSAIVEVTVRDTAGNAVSGATVALSSSLGGVTLPASGTTDANGRWLGTVSADQVCQGSSATLTAVAGGVTLAGTVTITSTGTKTYGACRAALWLDASDATTFTLEAGSRITQWRDKSGYGVHVSATTGSAARPTLLAANIGGLAAVNFNPANSQYLKSSTGVDARTIFLVTRSAAEANSDRTAFSVRTGGARGTCTQCEAFYFKPNNSFDGQFQMFLPSTTGENFAQTARTAATPMLMSSTTSSGNVDLSANRGTRGTGTYTGGLLPRLGETTIGAAWWDNVIGDWFNGEIAELVVFPRALSTTERDAVELALMAKWSLGSIAISAGNSQSANAGTSPTTAPQVRITDAGGTGIPGATVIFQVTAGGGRVNGGTSLTVTTDASGYAAVPSGQWVLDAGTNTLTAYYGTTGGSSVAFTGTGTLPSGVQLRLDATVSSSITVSSGEVTAWADQSGNARNATRPSVSFTGPQTGVQTIGGRNALYFNNDVLRVSANAALQTADATIFAVFKYDTVTATGANYNTVLASATDGTASDGYEIFADNSGQIETPAGKLMVQWGSFTSNSVSYASTTTTAARVVTLRASSNSVTGYNNGTAGSAKTAAGAPPNKPLTLGAAVTNSSGTNWGFYMKGAMGEVIFFNRALTVAERQQVERYLGWKWGITVL